MQSKEKLTTIINVVYFLFFILVGYYILKYALAYLIPFFISFSIVYVLQKPAIAVSQKLKLSKSIVTLFMLILIAAVIVVAIYFIAASIFKFLTDFINEENGLQSIIDKAFRMIDNVSAKMPRPITRYVTINSQTVLSSLYKYLSEATISFAENAVKIVPGFIISTIVSFVSACFFAFEYDNIIIFIKRQMSNKSVKFMRRFKKIVNFSLYNLFKGYMIMMLITFVEMLIGLNLLGVNNSVAIAFIISLVDLLPVFGTGAILVPWSIYSMIFGRLHLGIGLLVLYGVYSALRYFTEPKVIGKNVGMSPLLSLISMFIGLNFFGITGLILLPLLVSITVILNKNELIRLWK